MAEIRTSLTVVDQDTKEFPDQIPNLSLVQRMVDRLDRNPVVRQGLKIIMDDGYLSMDEATLILRTIKINWRYGDLMELLKRLSA